MEQSSSYNKETIRHQFDRKCKLGKNLSIVVLDGRVQKKKNLWNVIRSLNGSNDHSIRDG